MEIKSIIFDLGGVVFRDGTKRAIQEMKDRFHFSEVLCSEILNGQKSQEFRKDLITPKQYWDFVQTKIPSTVKSSEIRSIWYGKFSPNPGIFKLLIRLKTKYRLGIISGNVREKVDYLDKKYNFRKYFDVEVYSFDVHTNKPDKRMWKRALELLHNRASECVYFDDQQESVDVADSLGFKSFLFEDAREAIKQLSLLHLIQTPLHNKGYLHKAAKQAAFIWGMIPLF